MKTPPSFPSPDGSDDDDTSWAICTAAALWKNGRFAEAVEWVQKAATAAAGAQSASPDSNVRVVQLTIAATELSQYVEKWRQGLEADPKSVAISLDFDTHEVDVESLPSAAVEIMRATPAPLAKSPPPRLAPRTKIFSSTLPQDARSPLAVPQVEPKITEKKPLPPRGGNPSLSRTLNEAESSPLARRPSSAGPLGAKPVAPAPTPAPTPIVLVPEPKQTPSNDAAMTRRMDDIPTRRIAEGEAWPPADIDETSSSSSSNKR